MSEPRLFVLTLLAVRTDIDDTQLTGAAAASTLLTVQTSFASAENQGWKNAYNNYPEADGWFGHQVNVFELPNDIETDGYSVTLNITKVEA